MNNGGAIYVHSGSSLTLEDCIFEPLSESPHQAKSGGAIYAVSTTLLTMRHCTIDASRAENSGNGHGGAISAYGCASIVIEDSVISNNSSDNDGGGCCFFTNDIEQVTHPRLVRWARPSLAREPETYRSASKAARSVRGGDVPMSGTRNTVRDRASSGVTAALCWHPAFAERMRVGTRRGAARPQRHGHACPSGVAGVDSLAVRASRRA